MGRSSHRDMCVAKQKKIARLKAKERPETPHSERRKRSVTNNDADSYAALLPQHRRLIEGSAISEEVARERGYRSVEKKAELARLGFGRTQQIVPALLNPVHG